MTRKKFLISGASIAGPTFAFWLARFGFEATIVERADSLRLGGQNIDISGAAQKIAQLMEIDVLSSSVDFQSAFVMVGRFRNASPAVSQLRYRQK